MVVIACSTGRTTAGSSPPSSPPAIFVGTFFSTNGGTDEDCPEALRAMATPKAAMLVIDIMLEPGR